jgi:hypothetical protein
VSGLAVGGRRRPQEGSAAVWIGPGRGRPCRGWKWVETAMQRRKWAGGCSCRRDLPQPDRVVVGSVVGGAAVSDLQAVGGGSRGREEWEKAVRLLLLWL